MTNVYAFCVFLHVALQTFYNRKENIGEKDHNVGGKVSVEKKKKKANCKTGPTLKSLAKMIFFYPRSNISSSTYL